MGDFWGINAGIDGLILACAGFSDLLLTGLAVISINVLRPKGDRLCWSIVAMYTGLILFGLACYGVLGRD